MTIRRPLIPGTDGHPVQIASPDTIDSAVLGLVRPHRPFVANEWRLPYLQMNATDTFATGSLVMAYVPIPIDFTLDGLGFLTSGTAPTVGTGRVVLCRDNNGTPGVCVADSGALSVTTATGVKAVTGLGVTGTRGGYWVGLLAESITGTLTCQVMTNAQAVSAPLWSAMPVGSGAAPTPAAGGDGMCAKAVGVSGSQIGLTPATALLTNSNATNRCAAIWFKFTAVTA